MKFAAPLPIGAPLASPTGQGGGPLMEATYDDASSGPGPVSLPAGGLQKVGDALAEALPDALSNSQDEIELQDDADRAGPEATVAKSLGAFKQENLPVDPNEYSPDGLGAKLYQLNLLGPGNLWGTHASTRYDGPGPISRVLAGADFAGKNAIGMYEFNAGDAPGGYGQAWRALTGQTYGTGGPTTWSYRQGAATVTVSQGSTGRPGSGHPTIGVWISTPAEGMKAPVSTSARLVYKGSEL